MIMIIKLIGKNIMCLNKNKNKEIKIVGLVFKGINSVWCQRIKKIIKLKHKQ